MSRTQKVVNIAGHVYPADGIIGRFGRLVGLPGRDDFFRGEYLRANAAICAMVEMQPSRFRAYLSDGGSGAIVLIDGVEKSFNIDLFVDDLIDWHDSTYPGDLIRPTGDGRDERLGMRP